MSHFAKCNFQQINALSKTVYFLLLYIIYSPMYHQMYSKHKILYNIGKKTINKQKTKWTQIGVCLCAYEKPSKWLNETSIQKQFESILIIRFFTVAMFSKRTKNPIYKHLSFDWCTTAFNILVCLSLLIFSFPCAFP